MNSQAKQATPHSQLIAELLDSRVPKTEREHAAVREIERLRIERDEHARWRAKLANDLHDRETTISAAWEALRSARVHSEATIDDGIRLLSRQLDGARAECDEVQTLCDKLAGILGRTVDALRGAPPPLTHWSWHDLPERAEAMRAERDALRIELDVCRSAIEDCYDIVKMFDCYNDSDDACQRVTLRQLNEAIGKAAPRLLYERPEGQKLYGLRYRELMAERDELHRQLDEAEQDARRYRWIAGHCRSTSEHWGGRWSIIVDGPAPKAHDSEDAFDAAIDAAMRLTRPAEEACLTATTKT